MNSHTNKLAVVREQQRVEILARYARRCEQAKRDAQEDLRLLADACKQTAALLNAVLDQAQA